MTATGESTGTERPARGDFQDLLFARAPAEDMARYDVQTREAAAEQALSALTRHRRGESVVAVEPRAGFTVEGRPVSVITIVNDNMPFLFDSLMGEITDTVGEPLLVIHPVLLVQHHETGATVLPEDAARGQGDKVSVIHVHAAPLTEAAAEEMAGRLRQILSQVRAAVKDWRPMLARLDQAISGFRYTETGLAKPAVDEAIAFLEWLRDDNFTFLGMREYVYAGDQTDGNLEAVDQRGMGLLSDPEFRVLRRGNEPAVTTAEIRTFLHGPEPLLVTKANAKSNVHRRIYLDYIGVKTFRSDGQLAGELRMVGLFTSSAYTRSVFKIPYLRSKAQAVVARSGFDPSDHSGKALINVLESYPRDELFQINLPTLRRHAEAILALGERPRVRVLTRVDQFDRFVSVLVYVPRDRYDSTVRERIGAYLKEAFDGRVSAYYPSFPEGGLARVHFIIGRSGGKVPKREQAELEAAVRGIVRNWDDGLRELTAEDALDPGLLSVAARFPQAYRDSFAPREALRDAAQIRELTPDRPLAIDYYRRSDQGPTGISLELYHRGAPVPLSARVPILEHMGFRVISERTFELAAAHGDDAFFIHDMELESAFGLDMNLEDEGRLLEKVFMAVWSGLADDDGLNALAQTARLDPAAIGVLRAYSRYLQQAGIPQSQDFIAAALNRYPAIARDLFAAFKARLGQAGGASQQDVEARILGALDDVPSLDDDTILRRLLNLIGATLRTNFFALGEALGGTLALKLDSRAVEGLPEPRPWREIFVFGPEVEGVHLRFGPVARGGLRWSDRAQDYRTEVLGLVKAQQVKNAVIIPVGAKGGFYPKKLPAGGSRDAIFEAGRQAYITFVSTLLSITDNLIDGAVVPPPGVPRLDGDDPYFVVAADKGTATFSDTANAISQSRDFWLDDAFASGGSAGYDHKKMGITARGAWEAVKRHFREMDRDIQSEPFTVVGVGDMSGDVFGNGMLLSDHIKLIAAFDHRDIIIDPTPDSATSLAERQRLFALPRSSWQDYDRTKLSPGGMIVPRTQKSITLSDEARAAIGLTKPVATPAEIMSAILRAPVDLLWFGGIGTYVRATEENNATVGDRANDAIRVTAPEVGAKVVGEGANLGMTQRARIEFGLNGGRCNSDAIDNSGGVNSSDLEVNIKIALASAMRSGKLTREDRNTLLASMTEEVAALVLKNNYDQTLALSLAQQRGSRELAQQRRFISALEERGLLDRAVEELPSDSVLRDREKRDVPLTRAELGVLLAYAKLTLFSDLMASELPDDALLDRDLFGYFPERMHGDYREEIEGHRLRREIVATELANDLINRGGPTFLARMGDVSGAGPAEVTQAYVLIRDGYDLPALYAEIDALDNKIGGQAQLDLYANVGRLVREGVAWELKHGETTAPLGTRVAALREATQALSPVIADLLPPYLRDVIAERAHGYFKAGASEPLAQRIATLGVLHVIPDIMAIAAGSGASLKAAAAAFFQVTDLFRIGRIEEAVRSTVPSDYYDGLALSRASDMVGVSRRSIAVAALREDSSGEGAVEHWVDQNRDRVERTRERLTDLTDSSDLSVSRLTVAAGLMADLTAG